MLFCSSGILINAEYKTLGILYSYKINTIKIILIGIFIVEYRPRKKFRCVNKT